MDTLTIEVESGSKGEGSGKRREYFVDPKAGMYKGILIDMIDHGATRNSYGKVIRQIQPAFQLEQTIDEKMIKAAKKAKGLPATLEEEDKELIGRRLYVRGKKMNYKLFPGGTNMKPSDLFKFLSDLDGEPLPKGWKGTLNDYVGRTANLMIARNPDKRDPSIVYSNIVAVMPLEEDDTPMELDDTYVRVKDRENWTAPATIAEVEGTAAPAPKTAAELLEDDNVEIPFGSSE